MDTPPFTRAELTARLRTEGRDEVVASIREWLGHENNQLLPEASSVFCAWLEAGGRFAAIREQVFQWVRAQVLERDAAYLLKHVVRQRILPDDVTLKLLTWCATFAAGDDAIWKLSTLTGHVSGDLFEETLRTSEAVLEPILANAQLQGVTRSQVTTVLGNLAILEQLASRPTSREVDVLLCRWISHPQSFEPSPDHAPHHQTRGFLLRLLAALESGTGTPDLTPLLEWVNSWEEQLRVEHKDVIKRIRSLRHVYATARQRRAKVDSGA